MHPWPTSVGSFCSFWLSGSTQGQFSSAKSQNNVASAATVCQMPSKRNPNIDVSGSMFLFVLCMFSFNFICISSSFIIIIMIWEAMMATILHTFVSCFSSLQNFAFTTVLCFRNRLCVLKRHLFATNVHNFSSVNLMNFQWFLDPFGLLCRST